MDRSTLRRLALRCLALRCLALRPLALRHLGMVGSALLLLCLVAHAARAEEPPAADERTEPPDAKAVLSPDDGPLWVFGRSASIFQQSDDRIATRIAGWVDASYRDNDIPGRSASLNFDHINLYVDTRFRAWQAFVEAEYEHESNHTGFEAEREFELEQAYLRFQPSDGLSLRLGRFNSPIGIWSPIHWSILMDTIEVPIHEGRSLVPEQQVGFEAGGTFFPGRFGGLDAEIDYALFLGTGGDGLDQSGVEGVGFGADLRMRLGERHLLGLSAFRRRNGDFDDRTEHSLMLFGEAELFGSLTLRSELLLQRRERKPGSTWEKDISVFYAKVRWDFRDDAYLNYRFTYGDDDEDGRTAEEAIHTFTLGLQPHPALRLKLEYSDHQFRVGERRDFNFWGFSVGVLF